MSGCICKGAFAFSLGAVISLRDSKETRFDAQGFQPFWSHHYSVYPGGMGKLPSRYCLLNKSPDTRNLKGGGGGGGTPRTPGELQLKTPL